MLIRRWVHIFLYKCTHTHTHRYICIQVKVAFAGPGAAAPTKLTGHRSFTERDAEDALADDITLREAGLLK